MSIIALLLAIMLPVLSTARAEMKKLKCSSNMRSVAFHFQLFADDNTEDGQGDSAALGRNRFHINDFQDSLYGIDEFWDQGASVSGVLDAQDAVMLCPSAARRLSKREGYPCGSESIGPIEDVSLAVNMRLYRAEINIGGSSVLAPVALTNVRANVLNHPYVPLVLDVDGAEAAARGLGPFYAAPPRPDGHGPYADGRYWMPSDRHRGRANVAFVGGHVLSSLEPGEESWNWDYQAGIGN